MKPDSDNHMLKKLQQLSPAPPSDAIDRQVRQIALTNANQSSSKQIWVPAYVLPSLLTAASILLIFSFTIWHSPGKPTKKTAPVSAPNQHLAGYMYLGTDKGSAVVKNPVSSSSQPIKLALGHQHKGFTLVALESDYVIFESNEKEKVVLYSAHANSLAQ